MEIIEDKWIKEIGFCALLAPVSRSTGVPALLLQLDPEHMDAT